jgi:hypothetical protein
MTALNVNLRSTHPALTDSLLAETPELAIPDDVSLRLALTTSPTARLSGSVGGLLLFHPMRPDGQPLGIM